jgi:thioredoxin-related protein
MSASILNGILSRAGSALGALLVITIPQGDKWPAYAAHPEAQLDETQPAGALPDADLQIVVLEVEDCTYCSLFRRHVVPAYSVSPRSREVPLKFVDMNAPAYQELGLTGPVDTVPTTVLMRNNREVGRISGYVGPENFFHAINHLLGRTD